MLETKKETCCGCLACVYVCPAQVLKIKKDEKGFLYPAAAQKGQCLDCNACNSVCSARRKVKVDARCGEVYAVKAKEGREQSQSGGAFVVMARHVIRKGGTVYGASYDGKSANAVYARADTEAALGKMRGSKYVQAGIGNAYEAAVRDLKQGRIVLFCGTPCYADGMRRFAQYYNVDARLLLADFICHGTASPKVFADYIDILKSRYKAVEKFNFRDKSVTGWHGHRESFLAEGKKRTSGNYARIYYSHLAFREKCYSCPYTNMDRVGDVTIGDFWGIETAAPDFDDNRGCSIWMVNSEKGRKLWEQVRHDFNYIREDIRHGLQPTLQHPVERPAEYDCFWNVYQQYGLLRAAVLYCGFDAADMVSLGRYRADVLWKKIARKAEKFLLCFRGRG